jgi:hypothetical protein
MINKLLQNVAISDFLVMGLVFNGLSYEYRQAGRDMAAAIEASLQIIFANTQKKCVLHIRVPAV